MRRCSRVARLAGASLIELVVASALVSLILLCTQQLIAGAVRYYRISTDTMEVQQNVLVSVTKLTTELGESSLMSVRVDLNPPGGVIFATPRDEEGNIKYDPASGKAIWKRLLCYYVEDVGGIPCLVRKEKQLTPTDYPPIIAATETTAAFQADPSLPRRIVARRVTVLEVVDSSPMAVNITAEDERAEFLIKVEAYVQPRN
ncbi:MAG: hypothetical protein AB1758_36245 [Candidatus Eremiobacterota bacterium]